MNRNTSRCRDICHSVFHGYSSDLYIFKSIYLSNNTHLVWHIHHCAPSSGTASEKYAEEKSDKRGYVDTDFWQLQENVYENDMLTGIIRDPNSIDSNME